MRDAAASIGFKDPSVITALAVGLLCAAVAIYQAAGTGGHSYRSPFAGGGESSGSYVPASAEGSAPSTGSNPYAQRQQWGHGQSPGQPMPAQQGQGQGGQGGIGNPAGVGAPAPAAHASASVVGQGAAPGISAPPPTVIAGQGGIVAPPPSTTAGTADGGVEAPPPEVQAGQDDGGVVAPPPGQ